MNSDPKSSPKDTGEEDARGHLSPSPGEGDNGPHGVHLLFVVRITVPSVSPILLLPVLLPPQDPDPSCLLLEITVLLTIK